MQLWFTKPALGPDIKSPTSYVGFCECLGERALILAVPIEFNESATRFEAIVDWTLQNTIHQARDMRRKSGFGRAR